MSFGTQTFRSNEYVKLDGKRLDVLKLALAVLIVGLHSGLFYPLVPVYRLAVPMFFIMTSYFFFLKQNSLSTKHEKKAAMKKYSKRILKLYLFWFILLLPLTIYFRQWHVNVGFGTILNIVKSFLFGSTFKASWFLMASLLSILVVWFLSNKIKPVLLVAIGLFFYVFCCLTSNYYIFCERIPYFADVYKAYYTVFTAPFNSFPAALIFVIAGKYLADHAIFIPNKKLCVFIVFFFIMLYIEFVLILCFYRVVDNDCYFSLLPLSIAIFMFIGQNFMSIKRDVITFRKYSTIIFCSHCSFVPFVMAKMEVLFYDLRYFLTFITTLGICLVLGKFLLWLVKQEHFGFVKYSH